MKSSKVENIFNYTPPAEDAKTLSPFTYYQPFQSSFDPDFSVPPPKGIARQNLPQMKRRSGERAAGGLQVQGALLGHEDGGFVPRPAPRLPAASTSGWGDPEARSLCNSAWRCPAAPRPPFSGDPGTKAGGGSWARAAEEGAGGSAFGGLEGTALRMGSSLCQPPSQAGAFDGGLAQSTYYPFVLSPLGKNIAQNVYKAGHSRPMVCNFCKNNKEVPDIYLNHYLYDPETKVLSCPVLRKHVCEICGGTGDQAHTLQYCPVNRERGLQSKVPVLLKTRTITNSTGKIRRN